MPADEIMDSCAGLPGNLDDEIAIARAKAEAGSETARVVLDVLLEVKAGKLTPAQAKAETARRLAAPTHA